MGRFLLPWPLKPTVGVLCWYIRRGRKGGSRIMWFCSGAEGKNECEQGVTHGSCDKDVTTRQPSLLLEVNYNIILRLQ